MDVARGRSSMESHKSLESKVLPGCDTEAHREATLLALKVGEGP